MKFRLPNLTQVINLLLLVACIVGLVLLIGERLKLPQQQFLYERLTARYGDLDVGDGTEFVDDEIWEVYLPPQTAGGTPTSHELMLATKLISLRPSKTDAQTVPDFAVDIDAGLHHIQLARERQASGEMKIDVLLDGLSVISVVKPEG